jgi:hypothetical protein
LLENLFCRLICVWNFCGRPRYLSRSHEALFEMSQGRKFLSDFVLRWLCYICNHVSGRSDEIYHYHDAWLHVEISFCLCSPCFLSGLFLRAEKRGSGSGLRPSNTINPRSDAIMLLTQVLPARDNTVVRWELQVRASTCPPCATVVPCDFVPSVIIIHVSSKSCLRP